MGDEMRLRWIAVAAATALVLGACGNSSSSGEDASDDATTTSAASQGTEKVAVEAPGVTDDEIRVEGVASITNPLGGKYDTAADGVNAYFAMVNSQGGVHGRDLVLTDVRDDKLANNSAEVKGLIDADEAFAAVPIATLLFTGADQLVEAEVPAFGWTINPEWQGTPEDQRLNLFGQAGSYLCLGCEQPGPVYLIKEAGRHKAGLLAYNVPQSAKCLEGWDSSIERWGDAADAEVAFRDASLSYGTTDLSVQVSKMKDAGVDIVLTCMDNNGVVTLAKEMKKQGLDAIQVLPNAYDQEFLDEFGDLFEGSYVTMAFAPLETPEDLKPEGLQNYEEWIEETGGQRTENSIVGWLNADLLVRGLREAGPDFDRQKVIDAVNSMDDYTADGFLAGVDWSVSGHYLRSEQNCNVYMAIEDGQFVPLTDDAIFTCFDIADDSLEPTFK
jgi:ABC-type branched-subunit amino acid transport system substrate-binding protein